MLCSRFGLPPRAPRPGLFRPRPDEAESPEAAPRHPPRRGGGAGASLYCVTPTEPYDPTDPVAGTDFLCRDFDDAETTCQFEVFSTVDDETVCPRNIGALSPRVVPLIKEVSHTTSRRTAVAVREIPATVPRVPIGTLPAAATKVTRSPSLKVWLPSTISASAGFNKAVRGTELRGLAVASKLAWCNCSPAVARAMTIPESSCSASRGTRSNLLVSCFFSHATMSLTRCEATLGSLHRSLSEVSLLCGSF